MAAFAKRHPLLLYFILAFAVFWGCLGLGYIDRFRFWAPMLGALAPSFAALVACGLSEGETGVRALVRRLGEWRVGFRWYVVALGLPVAEPCLAAGLARLVHAFDAARIPALMPAMWVVFVFAASEELGWRGYALPRLLSSRGPVAASLLVGGLHAAWHWPLILLPHQYLSDVPILAYTTFVLAEAIVFTWIFLHTRGSVLMATLYHGTTNIAGVLYDGIDPAWMVWLRPSVSVLAALTVLLVAGSRLGRTRGGEPMPGTMARPFAF